MKHITTADALRALEEAVAEKGEDYAYTGFDEEDPRFACCLYVYGGQPSCIVGNALHRLGIPLDAFEPYEGKEIIDVVARVNWPIEVDAVDVLAVAQGEQDAGRPWGKALAKARKAADDA
jgi:hypothetical protein